MALISTIRKNTWLLIVSLGLALGAFIIMDISGSQNMGGGNQFEMGVVDGNVIDYRDFQRTEQILYGGGEADVYSKRDFLWNYFVEKQLVEEEAKALGLTVGKDELLELQFGNNLSPVVVQRFMDPQTGGIDRAQLNNIKQGIETGQLPENIRPFWAYQEREIIKYKLEDKLINLVAKGMYIPTWMVNQQNEWAGKTASFAYVKVPFGEIADSDVTVEDKEINSYIKRHSSTYFRKAETRIAEYLEFNIIPTSEDSVNIRKVISEKKVALAEAENDSLYAITNDGYFVSIYATKSDVAGDLPDGIFETPVGSVFGPYVEDSHYEIAKVVDEMIVPDSIEARHILRIAAPGQPEAVAQARLLLDSLKTELEAGTVSFDSLALQYGQDQTSSDGGKLGTFSRMQMIPEFSYEVFYKMDKGQYKVIQTSQGVHLVEVTDKIYATSSKGIQLAIVRAAITPSEKTQNEVYDYALKLITDNNNLNELKEAVGKLPNVKMHITEPLGANDFEIENIEDNDVARSIVQWLFEKNTKIGNLSDIFVEGHPDLYYNRALYIVGLKEIIPEGLPTADAVRRSVTPILMKAKKGELLKEKIASMDMTAIAREYSTDVDTVNQVALSSVSVLGLGKEPSVIATAFNLNEGEISQPILGENGVYVIKVLSKEAVPSTESVASSRKRISQEMKSAVGQDLMESLKANATIKDYRSNFF